MEGHKEIAQLLLKKGANVNIATLLKSTPLHVAVSYNQKELVELFVENDADVNASTIYGTRPLVRSIFTLISGSVAMLGFIWAFFEADGRGWHDLIAGTVVTPAEPSKTVR